MQTVVETWQYLHEAESLLGPDGLKNVLEAVAANPNIGDVMPGTNGFRKIRAARSGMGKRGGCRVIYIHRGPEYPVFLIAIFAKNEKVNLSKAERNALSRRADKLFEEYGGSHGRSI
jgi:hypothetical protein